MTPRPRVLLLVDTVGGGGAERVVADLAIHLDRRRFDVTVCATRAASFLAPEVRAAGVPIVVIGRRHRWDVRGLVRLWSYLRRGQFDVLHSHKFGSNVWARLFGRVCGIPVVIIHEHTWEYRAGFSGSLRARLDRVLTRFADVVITPSDADRHAWQQVVGIPHEKLVTIRNGVSAPPQREASIRHEYGIDEDAVVVGTVGRLEPQKNYELLLRAFSVVARNHPTARLIIVGTGSEQQGLEALVRDLDIASRVTLAGYRLGANSLMSEFDIVTISSRYEGLPLVVIEAMSVGRPVVATAVGGVPEVVVDGETGFLVPPEDPKQLADRLLRLIEDASLRESLGQRGLERYQAMFTVERMTHDVERVYLACLGRVGATGNR